MRATDLKQLSEECDKLSVPKLRVGNRYFYAIDFPLPENAEIPIGSIFADHFNGVIKLYMYDGEKYVEITAE